MKSTRQTLRFLLAAFALPLVCLTLSSPVALASDIAGHWEGAFTRFGAVQTVSVDLWESDSGWAGTYDIPDLILYRQPLREVHHEADTLRLRLFWGTFTCRVHLDVDEITGDNPNWGPPVALHLKRAFGALPFRIEPVAFTGGAGTIVGDLLIPNGNPPFPAVVVVEGSSEGGRSLWTYRSFGDLFARNGIAALVYDKRGVGASDGDIGKATLADLADDATQAVRYLQGRDDIEPSAVGLFGISQGGWIGPIAAQRTDAAFAILLGGPAVSIWQQELHRVEYSMRAGAYGEDEPDVFSAEEIAAALRHTQLGFDVARDPSRWSEWEASVAQAKNSAWSGYVGLDTTIGDLQGWLRFEYDPAETLRSFKQPLLALFGEIDMLVPPAENAELMQEYLKAAGNDAGQTVVFPGVGHDFMTGASLVGDDWNWPEAYWRWNRRAPGLVDTVITWTRRQNQK